MNRTRTVAVAVGATAALTAAVALPTGAANAGGSKDHAPHLAVGLADGDTLVSFSLSRPDRPKVLGDVSGLSGDRSLVGIDFRVQDGKLYAVGDKGGVYTLSSRAKATKVKQLTVALEGTAFGVDFNPAANALRIISDTGQNLRQPFATEGAATVADGRLTYPPVAPSTTPTPGTGVTAAAYTNNDLDTATATTLFDLDTAMDQVVVQAPANAGSLSATGKLGVDAGQDAGFDIGHGNRGYAALSVDGRSRLYSVDLLSGEARSKGSFPRSVQVSDIAVPIKR